ncbi:MAG: hypothetical protein NW201_14185 [Gemmatimonadales bacterium]|nr:hypothetical protein [Gemmatimonadales bacterium]
MQAQSLIVGIPSASITEPGHFVLAHESQLNVWDGANAYWNSFTFATYGIGARTELASSLYGLSNPGSGNLALGIGVKHSLPLLAPGRSRWEPTLTGGFMVPVSFSGRATGIWTYGMASARVPALRNTRLTGGISYGTEQIFGRRVTAAMVGVEAPLSRRFSIFADWLSGTHDLAALIAAVGWQANRHFLLIIGPKIPNNAASGRPALIIEAAYDFGPVGPAFGRRRGSH